MRIEAGLVAGVVTGAVEGVTSVQVVRGARPAKEGACVDRVRLDATADVAIAFLHTEPG